MAKRTQDTTEDETVTVVEQPEPPVPADAARSNLPAPPPAPPRDYTKAQALWERALVLVRALGLRPESLGLPFADVSSAPEWTHQSETVRNFWFDLSA